MDTCAMIKQSCGNMTHRVFDQKTNGKDNQNAPTTGNFELKAVLQGNSLS